MWGRYKNYLLLAILSLTATLVLWAPFFFRMESIWGIKLPADGMATVVANYDGPFYIVAAKTLYDPQEIANISTFSLPPIYYSAHYPLYPLLIKLFATIFPFLGYPYAMMSVTVLTSMLAVIMFYILLNELGFKKQSLLLASIFTIFPARWLIVRSVG